MKLLKTSPAAFALVRSSLDKTLPHPNLVRKWMRQVMPTFFLANFHLILEIGGAIFSMALLQFAMHHD